MTNVRTQLYTFLAVGTTGTVAMVATNSTAFVGGPPNATEPWHMYSSGDRPPYLDAWRTIYPDSTIPDRMAAVAGQTCFLCHQPSGRGDQGNCYREDIKTKLDQGMNIEQAIQAVAGDDSDGDGTSNAEEILMPRIDLPGEVGFNPGLIGPIGTSPCSTSPNAAVSNQPETPPVVCYADCDPNGVLDIFDFLCFQDSFVSGEPYACDCDTSTGQLVCDIFDFLCFQNAFVGGCP